MTIRFGLLFNLFIFCSIFVYVSPFGFVLNSDLQAPYIIMLIAVLLFSIFINHLKFDLRDLLLIFFSIFSFFFFLEVELFEFKKRIGLMIGVLIYLAAKKNIHFLHSATLIFALFVILLGIFIEYSYPQLYIDIVSKVLNYRGHELYGRGFRSFTPEPVFLGGSLLMTSVLLLYLHVNSRIAKFAYYFSQSLIIILLIFTKTFSSLVFLSFILLMNIGIKYTLYIGLLLGSIVLVNDFNYNVRSLVLVYKLLDGDFIYDASISHRLSNLFVGLYALVSYPLGLGGGMFYEVATNAYLNGYSNFNVSLNDSQRIVSSFSRMLVEHGLLFIFFLFVLFYFNGGKLYSSFKFVALFLMLVSFPISYPGMWIILAIENNLYKR